MLQTHQYRTRAAPYLFVSVHRNLLQPRQPACSGVAGASCVCAQTKCPTSPKLHTEQARGVPSDRRLTFPALAWDSSATNRASAPHTHSEPARTMKHLPTHTAWSTASFGGSADTSPMDLDALGEHLSQCNTVHGRFFAMHCVAERMNAYVTARLVTTLVVATLLLVGISSLVL